MNYDKGDSNDGKISSIPKSCEAQLNRIETLQPPSAQNEGGAVHDTDLMLLTVIILTNAPLHFGCPVAFVKDAAALSHPPALTKARRTRNFSNLCQPLARASE